MNFFNEFNGILKDIQFLVEERQIPILNFVNEENPDNIHFLWKLHKTNTAVSASTQIRQVGPSLDEVNFTCKLCPGKLSGIRSFQHKGKIPILILHYTGEVKKGKPLFSKRNKNQIFRSSDSEDLFNRMIQKVFGISYLNFFYQEYPGCNFSPDFSTAKDWKDRMNACNFYVKETIEKHNIKGIFMIGTTAVLYFGKENAKKQLDSITNFNFSGIDVPGIVLRSPEALLQLEEKKKKLAIDKNSSQYRNAKEEETNIKKNIVTQLTRFKNEIGL